ncbi:MAG TPA: DUF2157 domain-containing protein, partial [Gemmatimonadales bacterium]
DPATAARIRAWEASHARGGLRWPARLALGLGGILLAAGILLFVAAHWEALSPGRRFGLLLVTVTALHLGGVLAERSPGLALALHGCGTVALGGGIFLAGQIFHLQEHWPGGLMLWSLGAWVGWALRRDWAQGALAAVLTPAWLAGEWIAATADRQGAPILAVGLLGFALAYLGALPSPVGDRSGIRRVLIWIGGLAVIPAAIFLVMMNDQRGWHGGIPLSSEAAGWLGAVGLPLAVAWALRRREAWPVAVGIGWAVPAALAGDLDGLAAYLWLAILAVGLIGWGIRDRRAERVNLGVAGFALTVTAFYFSSVMDKMGRSAALIGLGLLFLGGGYLLERGRRRLLAELQAPG